MTLFNMTTNTYNWYRLYKVFVIGFPFFMAVVYPHVGSIMAFKGALASLWLGYLSPVILHIALTKPRTFEDMNDCCVMAGSLI